MFNLKWDQTKKFCLIICLEIENFSSLFRVDLFFEMKTIVEVMYEGCFQINRNSALTQLQYC